MKFNKDRDTAQWLVFTAADENEEVGADFNKLYINPESKYAGLSELDLFDKTDVADFLRKFIKHIGLGAEGTNTNDVTPEEFDKFLVENGLK